MTDHSVPESKIVAKVNASLSFSIIYVELFLKTLLVLIFSVAGFSVVELGGAESSDELEYSSSDFIKICTSSVEGSSF